jgi:hypothetical protein
MRPDPNLLPSALRSIAETNGLVFSPATAPEAGSLPIACRRLPIHEALPELIAGLPVAMNFHYVVLDMDKPEDVKEYTLTMGYLAAGYGGRVVHHERKFIKKRYTRKDGTKGKRTVQRIFLEYYAPYRTVDNSSNSAVSKIFQGKDV